MENIQFPQLHSELFGYPVKFPGLKEDFLINIELPLIPDVENKSNKIKRKGIHSKTKSSKLKSSKNYMKKYRGQGRKS